MGVVHRPIERRAGYAPSSPILIPLPDLFIPSQNQAKSISKDRKLTTNEQRTTVNKNNAEQYLQLV